MLRLILAIVLAATPAWAQSTRTFGNYMQGLPSATTPLAGTEPMIVFQGGAVRQVPSNNVGGSGTTVYNAAQNGWTCDSTDHSTAAQTLLNTVSAAGGGTIFFPVCSPVTFIGTASGTNLTVSSVSGGKITPGMIVAGNGIPKAVGTAFTTIVSQSSGPAGGAGVYVTSQSTSASASNLIAQATYRADSRLDLPLITNSGNVQTTPSIRLTGAGAGTNINGFDVENNVSPNTAILDLRYQGQVSSAVGYVATVGSGYSNGTQTITVTGGTCSQQPVYQVKVSGTQLVNSAFGGNDLNSHLLLVTAGVCTIPPANPVSFTGAGAGSNGTLTLHWTQGKLQGLGAGALEIDHLTILDAGSQNSTPLVYMTNMTLSAHDSQFFCTGNASQDAIVLGGMQATGAISPPNQNADSPFLGYGTYIHNNLTDSCNRFVFTRTFGNEVKIIENVANGFCSGDRFIEFITGQSGGQLGGEYVTGNYTEACSGLKYGYVLTSGVMGSVFSGNSVWDSPGDPSFISDYFIADSTSGGNVIITGFGSAQQAAGSLITGDPTSIGSTTIIGRVTNFYNHPPSNNSFGEVLTGGTFVSGPYTAANCPHGPLSIVDSNNNNQMMMLGVDSSNGRAVIDAVSPTCTNDFTTLELSPVGGQVTFGSYANDATTGTSAFKLAKLTTAAPSTAIITATADSIGIMGIATRGAGTSGSVAIATQGIAPCVFDGTPTPGHYVQNSSSIVGDCTDAGATRPTTGQIIGRVLDGNNLFDSAYPVSVFPAEIVALPTNGVSCAANTTSQVTLTVTNGIVTHC